MKAGIIFEGYGYVASIAGFEAVNGPFLSVTRKGRGGRYISGQAAIDWAEEIKSAIDKQEARALCYAIYTPS